MTGAEERMRVLGMIERGQLTAAEGARLLDALQAGEVGRSRPQSDTPRRSRVSRRLRVHVTDLRTGHRKVDITMPWSLVNVGLDMGAHFAPAGLGVDFREVLRNAEAGGEGKVLDVVDAEDGERVEIYVEQA